MSQGKGMLRADVDDSLLGCSLRRTGLHCRSYDGLEHHLRLCLQHASQSGNQLPRATTNVLCMACHCAAPTSHSRCASAFCCKIAWDPAEGASLTPLPRKQSLFAFLMYSSSSYEVSRQHLM